MGDVNTYKIYISATFGEFGIPYFLDSQRSIHTNAMVSKAHARNFFNDYGVQLYNYSSAAMRVEFSEKRATDDVSRAVFIHKVHHKSSA